MSSSYPYICMYEYVCVYVGVCPIFVVYVYPYLFFGECVCICLGSCLPLCFSSHFLKFFVYTPAFCVHTSSK
jgi:hypothetical protein